MHVLTPRGDLQRLLVHDVDVVGEHLERDRPVSHQLDDITGERFVVGDTGCAHQGGIGRESADQRIGAEAHDPGPIGTVGEDLGVAEVEVHQVLLRFGRYDGRHYSEPPVASRGISSGRPRHQDELRREK